MKLAPSLIDWPATFRIFSMEPALARSHLHLVSRSNRASDAPPRNQ
jgi:hypothetical protein